MSDGQPCPVCGSPDHPNIAQKSAKALTQSELENLKAEVESVNEKRRDSNANASKLNTRLELMSSELLSHVSSLETGKKVKFEELAKVISHHLGAQKKIIDKLIKSLEAANSRKDERDSLIIKEKSAQNKIEKFKESLSSQKEEIAEIKNAISVLKSETKSLRKTLIFKDEEEASTSLQRKKESLETMKEALKQKQSEHQNARQAIVATKAVLESNNNEIAKLYKQLGVKVGASTKIETSEITIMKDTLSAEEKSLEEKRSLLFHSIENNKGVLKDIKKFNKERDKISSKYNDVELMSKIANGTLKGKKVQFETFVQQVYFDMILTEANKRLSTMSENRYQLIRQEKFANMQGKKGLDLDVFDAWTGKTRGAKSLSGGESFNAALSLALGLSDVVQYYSSGISIDTMFVDEGFGSLDSDALEKALEVISSLSHGNRLIGIISHVDELKKRIDNKIVVEKDKQGSGIHLEV